MPADLPPDQTGNASSFVQTMCVALNLPDDTAPDEVVNQARATMASAARWSDGLRAALHDATLPGDHLLDAVRRLVVERADLRHQRNAYADALTDIAATARRGLADRRAADETKPDDTVAGRAYAAVCDLVRERDAYRKAKAENDERFMRERDEARRERDILAAALAKEQDRRTHIARIVAWREATGDGLKEAKEACEATGGEADAREPATLAAQIARAEEERDALRARLVEAGDDYVRERDEVSRLVRERDDLQARLTREAATHAAREGVLSRLVADLQGQLRDADATAAGLRASWEDTAARHARNEDYYRALLDEVAAALGPDAFVADDGSVSDAPLRAKVPELVRAMSMTSNDLAARLAEAEATLANERGEGEPPEPGWQCVSSTIWNIGCGGQPGYASVSRGTERGCPWHWYAGGFEGVETTARAAMRAASERLRGAS